MASAPSMMDRTRSTMQPPPLYRDPSGDRLSLLRRGEIPSDTRQGMRTLAPLHGGSVGGALRAAAERGVAIRREGVLERRRHGIGKGSYWAWFVAGQSSPLLALTVPWPGPGVYFTTEDPSILVGVELPTPPQIAAARRWFLEGQGLDEAGVTQLERGVTPDGLRSTRRFSLPPGSFVVAAIVSVAALTTQLAGPPWHQVAQLVALVGFLAAMGLLLWAATRKQPGGQRVIEVRGPAAVAVDMASLGGQPVRIGDCSGSFPYDRVGSLIVDGAIYRGFVLEGTRSLVALLPA